MEDSNAAQWDSNASCELVAPEQILGLVDGTVCDSRPRDEAAPADLEDGGALWDSLSGVHGDGSIQAAKETPKNGVEAERHVEHERLSKVCARDRRYHDTAPCVSPTLS